MVLTLAVLLLHVSPPSPVAPADTRPVRVWLGSSGVLLRGTAVRVYVQVAQDGNLIVLHRRTDGRIEVLFPGKPNDDPFVRAGTYEIQATPTRVAFVVAEPDGSGLVLAALTPRTYRFDEFARAAAWNPDALAPSWDGSDGEGVLSDIVQRMLGDGYFNYDIASYTVAPPIYATQPDTSAPYPVYPTCTDCTFIGYQENVFESVFLCDPFFLPCLGDGRFHHRRPPRDQPAAPAPSRTIALAMRAPPSASLIPRQGRTGTRDGFVRKSAAPIATGAPLEPRTRTYVPIRAVPLGPGRPLVAHAPAAPALRRHVGPPTAAPPVQVVRLALSPTRVREEPEDAPGGGGGGGGGGTQSVALTGLTVTPPVRPAPRPGPPVAPPEAIATRAAMAPRARGLAIAGASAAASAPQGTERGRTVALPPAVFHGAQARMPVARTGARRR